MAKVVVAGQWAPRTIRDRRSRLEDRCRSSTSLSSTKILRLGAVDVRTAVERQLAHSNLEAKGLQGPADALLRIAFRGSRQESEDPRPESHLLLSISHLRLSRLLVKRSVYRLARHRKKRAVRSQSA